MVLQRLMFLSSEDTFLYIKIDPIFKLNNFVRRESETDDTLFEEFSDKNQKKNVCSPKTRKNTEKTANVRHSRQYRKFRSPLNDYIRTRFKKLDNFTDRRK